MAKDVTLTPPPLTTAEMRSTLAEHREAERLQRQIDALEAKAAADRQSRYDAEDAEIAAEQAALDAEQAESARRAIEEPPGSLAWAARQARERGSDVIPPDVLDAMSREAYNQLQREHRDLFYASVEALGNATLKGRV